MTQVAFKAPALAPEVDWSRCLLPPYQHQKVGVQTLLANPTLALFDEPGAGKTKQIIDTACFLAQQGETNTVLVITPASVRAVWAGEFGEIDKHAWFPAKVSEFHARTPHIPTGGPLQFVVTNFEFLRNEDRLKSLITQLTGRKLWIVVDESIRIKSNRASQTKAVLKLARYARRRTILNGTPVGNNPLDLWAQFEFLDPRIIGCENYYHFRARYAVMVQRFGRPEIIGWQNLPELQARIAPYCLRRLKVDCLDLPDKTYTIREARMGAPDWKLYKQMRDDCIAFLDSGAVVTAPQAVVRILRLSQITAGFIGGIAAPEADLLSDVTTLGGTLNIPREIGTAKLDAFLADVETMLEEDPRLKLLVWCRFRAELARARQELAARWPHILTGRIEGGQGEAERRATVDLFQRTESPMVLFGNPQAGGLGLTLTAAHRVVYLSNDYNLVTRLQSEDRVHRPGQRHPVLYTDVVATGPDGQRTIDHVVITALRKKQDLASWTTDVWRRELSE